MNIKRLVLLDPNEKLKVKKEFERSIETLQRVKQEIVDNDLLKMTSLVSNARKLENLLLKTTEMHTNYTTFSNANQVIDILGDASNYMEKDFAYFSDKIIGSMEMLKELDVYFKVVWMWRFLLYYSPIENGTYNYYSHLTSCMDEGLDLSGELRHRESPETTTVEPENSTSDADEGTYFDYIAFPIPEIPMVDMEYFHPIFNTEICDNTILYDQQFKYYHSELYIRDGLKDSVEDLRDWYESLVALFPEEFIEPRTDHQQCINMLDWMEDNGLHLAYVYWQYLTNMTEKVNYIMERYVHGTEERSDLDEIMQSYYDTVSDFNTFILDDSMSKFRTLADNPLLEIDSDAPVINSIFNDDDPLACLWLLNDLMSFSEVGTMVQILYIYYTSNHEKLITEYSKFQDVLDASHNLYQNKIKSDIDYIEDYLNGNIQKLELVNTVNHAKQIKATVDFVSKINEVEESINKLLDLIITERGKVHDIYAMPLNLTVPYLSYSKLNETILGKQLNMFKDAENTGINMETMEEHFGIAFLHATVNHFDVTVELFQELSGILTFLNDQYMDDIVEQREDLQLYKSNMKMDADFYM